MTKKKIWIWRFTTIFLTLAIMLIASISAIGCANNEFEEPAKEPTLSQTDVSLDIFEKVQLKVLDWEGETVWASGNVNVVSVDETGMLCGIGEGSTNVTADIGEKQFICNVTVFPSDNVPMVFVKGVESIELLAGDAYTVEPYVSYDGVKYDNATFSYKTYDTTIASVTEDGTVAGLKIGETQLEISAEWETYKNDIRLKTVIPVVVKDNLNVRILGASELDLYTYALKAYSQTFEKETELTAIVQDNGVAVDEEAIVWHSSDETVATVENGVVCAVSVGSADITVRYEKDDNVFVSNAVRVNVARPVADITTRLPVVIDCWLDDSKTTIAYDLRKVFLDPQTAVTGILDEAGNTIAYTDGVFENTLEKGDFVWVVENENYAVKTRVFCATKVITTALELATIETYGNQTFEERVITKTEKKVNEETGLEEEIETKTTYEVMYYTGYFALGNDITFTKTADYNGKSYIEWKDPSKSTLTKTAVHMGSVQYSDVGFSGVFEGMGYTVSNVKLGRGGLFGTISESGIVRNFNVEKAQLTAKNASVIALNLSGLVENVKIEVDQKGNSVSSPMAYLGYKATLRNVAITTENAVREDGGCASVIYWTKGGCTIENVSVNATTGARLVCSDGTGASALITVRDGKADGTVNDVIGDDKIWE